MTKDEALKLALEALKQIDEAMPFPVAKLAQAAIKEALAQQDSKDKEQAKTDSFVRQLDEALAQPEQETVALFKWLPEGATHIGRISVRTSSGGSLAMTTHAFKYDSAVLKVYVTDNDNEYHGWRDAKDCFFHLNFPVLPLYTSPPPQRKPLTDEEIGAILEDINAFGTRLYTFARAIEAAHGIKENT